MDCQKKCPLEFNDFSFKNILLILLILKQVWSMFKDNKPDINLEEIILKNQLPANIPFMNDLGPIIKEINVPQPVPKPSCNGNWMFTKILLVLLLFYIIYFIKTVVDKITLCSMELNVNGRNSELACPLMECPLGFGRCSRKQELEKQENKD
jgi:hypothetical protein